MRLGWSPYYLMFGCKLHLPIDLIFGTNLTDLKGNHSTYIENLKKRMAWAYMKLLMTLFRRNRKGTNDIMTAKFNVQSSWSVIQVLLQHTTYKGKHKIQDWWENTIYEVVESTIQKHASFQNQTFGRDDDRVKIVHRNLLLPLLSRSSGSCWWTMDNSRSLVHPKETMGANGWQLQQVQLPVMCITQMPMKEYS